MKLASLLKILSSSVVMFQILDGQEITRTERMKALQEFIDVKAKIIKQQVTYKANRVRRASCAPGMLVCSG